MKFNDYEFTPKLDCNTLSQAFKWFSKFSLIESMSPKPSYPRIKHGILQTENCGILTYMLPDDDHQFTFLYKVHNNTLQVV